MPRINLDKRIFTFGIRYCTRPSQSPVDDSSNRAREPGPATVERQLNQAVFHRFWIYDRGIRTADLHPPLTQLLGKDLDQRLATETKNLINAQRTPEGSETLSPHSPQDRLLYSPTATPEPTAGRQKRRPGLHRTAHC